LALSIKRAILHILRGEGPPSVFSQSELDIDSEVCEAFILKHVKKLIGNPAVRTAVFKPDSAAFGLVQAYQQGAHFKETTIALAEKMQGLMARFKKLPPCDLLLAHVANKGTEYLAVLKLSYQEVYRSCTKDAENQLKVSNALPFSSGKVEHACLIGLGGAAVPISVVEKPEVLDGNAVLYFSELFLECETSPSKKEQAKLIDEISNEFVQEYHENSPKVAAKIKSALVEEAEAEEGFVSIDNVAAQVFADNEEEKAQYIATMRDAGVIADVPLGEKVARAQFATQRIKGDNGVEIKFPAGMAADEDELEITTHPDGTVTLVIKRLRIV